MSEKLEREREQASKKDKPAKPAKPKKPGKPGPRKVTKQVQMDTETVDVETCATASYSCIHHPSYLENAIGSLKKVITSLEEEKF